MADMVDLAAERAVLSGLFNYGADAHADIADILGGSRAFSSESNQLLYRVMEHALGERPDARLDFASLLSSARALGVSEVLDKPDERQYLRAVTNFPIRKENVRKLAGKVKKLEWTRELFSKLTEAQTSLKSVTGDEPIDHILGMAENPLLELTALLTATRGDGPARIGDGLRGYVEHVAAEQRDIVGVSTGYPQYDLAIGGGLRRRTVNLVGARVKVGKSMFGDNVALHTAGNTNLPTLMLDTEMGREDHWNRMLAYLSNVPINDIETGKFAQNSHKKQQVWRAVDRLEKMPYDYLSIAGQPFEDTLSVMRRWVRNKVGLDEQGEAKPCVIIFDYLKLMSSEVMENRSLAEFQVLGFMMTSLHNFTVRWGVPCLAFVQLNRDGINREDTDVVSQSDRLIWLCSNFSIYKKKTDDEMAEQTGQKQIYNRKLVPIVARHGAGLDDGDYINFMAHGSIAKIVEGPTRNQLSQGATRKGGMIVEDDSQEAIPFAA